MNGQFACERRDTVEATEQISLTKAEWKLIQLIRAMDYGEVRVMIKDQHPVRVEEIRRSIQLPSEK